eukprot:4734687-Alexandrium_andersonii.AAC.1
MQAECVRKQEPTPAQPPGRMQLPRRALRWECGVRRVVYRCSSPPQPLHAHRCKPDAPTDEGVRQVAAQSPSPRKP